MDRGDRSRTWANDVDCNHNCNQPDRSLTPTRAFSNVFVQSSAHCCLRPPVARLGARTDRFCPRAATRADAERIPQQPQSSITGRAKCCHARKTTASSGRTDIGPGGQPRRDGCLHAGPCSTTNIASECPRQGRQRSQRSRRSRLSSVHKGQWHRMGLLHEQVTSDLWCREVPLEGCPPCPSPTPRSSATTS